MKDFKKNYNDQFHELLEEVRTSGTSHVQPRTTRSEGEISQIASNVCAHFISDKMQPLLVRIAGAKSDLQSFKTSAHTAIERRQMEQASHNAQMKATKQFPPALGEFGHAKGGTGVGRGKVGGVGDEGEEVVE